MATEADWSDWRWWKLALVTAPLIVLLGTLSGYLSQSGFENDWYAPLDKPGYQPPSWAFGVTWTILYALMGIALALVVTARSSVARSRGLVLFFVQLALNFSWSPIFFGGGMIDIGFLVIVALVVLVAVTLVTFWRVKPLAGLLLLPYLAWLCLATALNFETGRLNPGADRVPLGITGE